MEIAELGEFGLIGRLTKDLPRHNESTIKAAGDDCAVMHYPDREVLITTDMLMEGIHFDLTYYDMKHLGYKSAMVNISDIFAMNGTPRQMLVCIALSKRFKVEDLDDFYEGLRMACDKWGVDIVGGDTTRSPSTISRWPRPAARAMASSWTKWCSLSPTLPGRNTCCSVSCRARPAATSSNCCVRTASAPRR